LRKTAEELYGAAMKDQAAGTSTASEPSLFAVLKVAHALQDRLEQSLGEVGLSGAKLGVLSQLVGAGEALPLGVLAERLSCVRSNITQLVDRLEADGLVRRVDDRTDRRMVRADVTALGAKRQAAGAARLHAVETEFFSELSADDRTALARVVDILRP
jgi:DNA-binding MarR family transcriptional regulator